MYIEKDDYLTLIDQEDLRTITSENADKLSRAEGRGLKEVSGYLRQRYRIDSEYKKTGGERNENIVGVVLDCVLYHLCASLAGRLGLNEIRQKRYEQAIRWLQRVSDGKDDPGIPSLTNTEEENPEENPEYFKNVRFGCMPKNDYSW